MIDRYKIHNEDSFNYLKEIPDNWRFSFQYFVNKSPVNIVYDNLPTNNLVLTHILVKNNQTLHDFYMKYR